MVGDVPSLGCLAEIDSPEVREFPRGSLCPRSTIHFVGEKVDAIRTLAQLDRDSAFLAAETRSQPHAVTLGPNRAFRTA